MIILQRDEIEKLFNPQAARVALRRALEALSVGAAVVPEPACLRIRNSPAECQVKTGYLTGDDVYAVKVSNGFYDNPRRGLPSSDGMVLLFSAETGAPLAVLIDRGFLTDMRTALTGALATQLLARPEARRVGIVGCGTQARVQLLALHEDRPQLQARVWGRRREQVQQFVDRLGRDGIEVTPEPELEDLVRQSEIIITATAAHAPLVADAWVQPGTHITAVGADAEGKQELDIGILRRAHWVVADCAAHSVAHGEAGVAVRAGVLDPKAVLELGALLPRSMVRPEQAITVADLTGVAVQDVAMARSMWEQCNTFRMMAS